jgi:hypothetical protein
VWVSDLGLVVEGSARHPAGWWQPAPPFALLPKTDADALGAAVERALTGSAEPADDWKERFSADTGRRWDDLAMLRLVAVERRSGGRTELHGYEPSHPGFVGWHEADVDLVDPSPGELGRAVLDLLERVPARRAARQWTGRPLVPFGRKTAWLAVKADSRRLVVRHLRLAEPVELDWPEGLERAEREGVFVTPPVQGWVLAVGHHWVFHPPDVAGLSHDMATEVQLFASHRGADAYTWTRAVDGEVRRAFACGGLDIQEDVGALTAVERRSGLDDFRRLVGGQLEVDDERFAEICPDEETVFGVAGSWSLDPSRLDALFVDRQPGTWGIPGTVGR